MSRAIPAMQTNPSSQPAKPAQNPAHPPHPVQQELCEEEEAPSDEQELSEGEFDGEDQEEGEEMENGCDQEIMAEGSLSRSRSHSLDHHHHPLQPNSTAVLPLGCQPVLTPPHSSY